MCTPEPNPTCLHPVPAGKATSIVGGKRRHMCLPSDFFFFRICRRQPCVEVPSLHPHWCEKLSPAPGRGLRVRGPHLRGQVHRSQPSWTPRLWSPGTCLGVPKNKAHRRHSLQPGCPGAAQLPSGVKSGSQPGLWVPLGTSSPRPASVTGL